LDVKREDASTEGLLGPRFLIFPPSPGMRFIDKKAQRSLHIALFSHKAHWPARLDSDLLPMLK
jgi:hypothetical protein